MNAFIQHLKATGQDFEFYPTTSEIIDCLIADLEKYSDKYWRCFQRLESVLDIGAGNGKVLRALGERAGFTELYAIEKSIPLCEQLDRSIFIIGTEFHEQSLVCKRADVTFCNPPYSEFKEWAAKIIRESASRVVYLVIPIRWQESTEIAAAIEYREAEATVVGDFTFTESEDRQARGTVQLIRVELSLHEQDAFDRFFNREFASLNEKFADRDGGERTAAGRKGTESPFASLTVGPNYPERLVALYNEEMDKITRNYELVGQLDVALLREFDISPMRILGCLKARLAGLRNTYWQELFSNMRQITDRLTSTKRKRILDKLQRTGSVDFTLSNIHAIVLWVLKDANIYLDEQLIETFDRMADKANVKNYASNERVFTYDRWRYNEEKPSHFALEYRVVLERVGGIHSGSFETGLSAYAAEFIGDLLTVARNLGFQCETNHPLISSVGRKDWVSGQLKVFGGRWNDEYHTLIEVRAYLNGNLHIRMHQDFALALNVENGRLRGWIHSGAEAAKEMGQPRATEFYGKQLRLASHSLVIAGSMAGSAESPAQAVA